MFTSATCLACLLRMGQFSLIYRPYDADLLHLPHTYCACANADFLYLQNRWCWPPSSATCFCSLRMRQCDLFIYRTDDAELLHLPHVWNAYCACANADFLFTYRTDDADILHLSHVWNANCACANADFLFIYRTDDADLLHLSNVWDVWCACVNADFILFTEQMMLTFFICHMFLFTAQCACANDDWSIYRTDDAGLLHLSHVRDVLHMR